jgi:hypothetical protein
MSAEGLRLRYMEQRHFKRGAFSNGRRGNVMSDFNCQLCDAPVGFLVQGEGCIVRCSRCNAPGPATLMEFIAGNLRSRYRAVLLSRKSEVLSVVAEGVGVEIVPQVLAAASDGKFVWMKPMLEAA